VINLNIKYIYVYKYNNRLKDIDLNFGSKYNYKFVDDKYIECTEVYNYVQDFYSEYNCIENLTAIIGKNASGKTTILRAINDIFSDDSSNIEYIIIYAINKQTYFAYNFRDKRIVKFRNNIENIESVKLLENQVLQDKIREKIKLVYYSGIFDKSSPLNRNDYLIDISTNRLVRDIQFNGQYSVNGEENEDEWYLGLDNKMNFIDKFELDEIERKVKFYIKSKENEFMEEHQLFKFPEKLTVMFIRNEVPIKNIKDSRKRNEFYSKSLYEALDHYLKLIDDYRLDILIIEEKEKLRIEFLILAIIEMMYASIIRYNVNLDIVAQVCKNYMNSINKNGYQYDIEKFIENLFDIVNSKYIRRLRVHSFVEQASRSEFRHMRKKLYEGFQLIHNNDYDDDFDLLTYGYIEEQEKYVIDNIKKNIEGIKFSFDYVENNIKPVIEEIDNKDFNYNIENFLNIENETLESIEQIEYILEDGNTYLEEETISNFLKYKKLVEDYISYFMDLLLDIIENGSYKEEDGISINLENQTESIEEFINQKKLLINNFLTFTEANNVSFDENTRVYTVESTWTSSIAIEFIKSYYDSELEGHILKFSHEELSSGQKAYLDMFSRLVYISNQLRFSNAETIILLDEGEIYLHPEIQIKFIYSLLELLNRFFKSNKIHLILTSNSPFIISDIPNTNIIYLENNRLSNINTENLRTLGANINVLLVNSFFMNDGTIGKYALNKINLILENLLKLEEENEIIDEQKFEKFKAIVDLIGEPLIKYKLEYMLDNIRNKGDSIDQKINYYKQEIEKLQNRKKSMN
jgi:predicted ATPase